MTRKKYVFRQLLEWAAAMMIAVLLCNWALYLYHHPAAWIHRSGSATDGILNPNSVTLQGTEGRGQHGVDGKGYLNPDLPLAEDYILVVGSSYVQGKEVQAGKRFTDLMNTALAASPEELAVYTVSQDGFYFHQMVKGFQALLQEFPDAGTIILEVNANSYSAKALTEALEQHPFDPSQTGEVIYDKLSVMQKIVIAVKEWFPILNLGKSQLTAMLSSDSGSPAAPEASQYSMEKAVDAAVALLRAQYNGRLIIFYHPDVDIRSDGSMMPEKDERAALYREACGKYGVEFVDVSDAFQDAYARDYTVPYGFSNTKMGSGHFNEAGHQICADTLLEVLKGGDGA